MPLIESLVAVTDLVNKTSMYTLYGFGTLASLTAIGFVAARYKTVPANKFIAKTGPFVRNNVYIGRKTLVLPFQNTHYS